MRNYGRVKTSIWADDDFRKLTDPAQALYLRLLSSPTMTLVGVCDWRPKRLALLTCGMTSDQVEEAGSELEDHEYVLIDDESEEILVRTFVKHEAVVHNPKTAAGAAGAFTQVSSKGLRSAVTRELLKIREAEPDLKGWEHLSIALRYPTDHLPDRVSNRVSDRLLDRVPDRVPIPLEPFTKNLEPISDASADAAAGLFDAFWSAYPKKVNKVAAERKWKTTTKRVEPADILDGLHRYILFWQRKGTERDFIPGPDVWLNKGCWADELENEDSEQEYYNPQTEWMRS